MEEVRWIEAGSPAALAIVIRPRGDDELLEDLLRIKLSGVQTLVSLLEYDEAAWLGLAEEGPLAEEAGMRFLSHPICDMHVPLDAAAFRRFAGGLADRIAAGEHIGVHCRGSIGRATITAACTLIHLGLKPVEALAAIEKARGCPVPETEEQLSWILDYRAEP
jgi:protein-tyrosine phosphatase